MNASILKKFALAVALFAGALGITTAQAQPTTFTGSYTQNFDGIGTTGTTLPPGFTSMAIAGGNGDYTAANPISATAIANAAADTQTLLIWNVGTAVAKSGTQSYNIGCWDSLTDRALGTDPTGTGAQVIQLAMTNNTGGTLYGVTFSYDCKCLTNGSAGTEQSELPGYCLFYSTTGTSAANWTEVGYAGTINDAGGIPAAHGLCLPNYTQGTTMSSGPVTILFATPLTNNGVMYFRWADDNNIASSPDQMLAIDNISIATYTPAGPAVSITSPANNASFIPGSSVAITASASETGGTVTNVAFYSGSTKLGNVASAPYIYTWSSVPAGSYALTAVAADSSGILATSAVVNITVAHLSPTVAITSPASGASYAAPASIALAATASDTDGNVTNVAFYQGSTLLANVASAPYSYSWTGVAAGSYTLTAVASVDTGASATSTAVSVTVTNLPNPLVASFTGSYSQNFDLALTNGNTTMPAGFQAMYLPGSHFTYTNGTPIDSNAIVTATFGTGASTLVVWNVGSAVTDKSYQLFNIGCWDSLNDRALGTDPTGTGGTVIQLALTNNTGNALNGVIFSYTEKCLTNGSTSNGSYTDDGTERLELPGYSFFYSLTGDTNATNWFGVNALCLTNWVQGTSSDSGPVAITFPTPLPANGVMYFRWADDNCVASSPDQMYAIDNISITANNPNGPVVSFTSPMNNQNYIPGSAITLSATATDLGTNITSVSFYVGSTVLPFPVTANGSSYTATIPGVYVGNPGAIPVGSYSLNAVATDAAGLSATSAVVNVTVGYVPPTVSLTSPASGASFPAYSSIPLSASASSADGTVTNVAFYHGATLLANVTSAPFNFTWVTASAGSYNLTALATDSHGLTATSSVVSITVTNGFGVSLTSPANNVNYLPGSSVPLAANAFESGGSITNVEFYANGTDLGGVTSAPYNLTWPSVLVGNYALTAVASDASGLTATSSVVNITVSTPHVPPTVSLTSPANNAVLDVSTGLSLSATAACPDGTVTNVAFYQNGFLVANVTTAPYNFIWTNAPTGIYTLTALATDNSGASTTSSVVSLTATNSVALATLQQIKTVFIIPLENHDLVQQNPQGNPQQLLGNPACPYFNSLITPGNSNAVQVSYATHYYSCAINGEHPSEPNYVWSEAGTDFGVRTDNDPTSGNNQWSNVQHLSGQLTTAGIRWHDYQEDVEYSSSEEASASGSGAPVNPYNGTTDYNYAVKHNPMAFFTDTQNKNCYPLTNFWADLANNNIGRYNWITPDQYNEMHSSLPSGYTYNGTPWTGDQAAIASGDNFLSIVIPKIMASQAYKDHGVIIIWTDETESTDDTNTTLPYVIISSLAKGNAYASTLPYSHSSDLKTMDELFGLAYQTNAIPSSYLDAQNTGYNYMDGRSATIYDLSDFFQPASTPAPALTVLEAGSTLANGGSAVAFGAVNIGASVTNTFTVTNTGSATLVVSNVATTGADAGDFNVSGITLPASVVAGRSTTFNVVFSPLGAGARVASLQITDNDTNNNPFTLTLNGTGVLVPPTVSLTGPASGASFAAPTDLALAATTADIDGTVTNVAFYQGTTLLGNVSSAPFTFTTANIFAGSYALTAVATDNNGLSSTSSVVNVTITNTPALAVLQSIKTVFIIAMENHDLVQKNPTGSPQQMLGNPAAPYFNSLITPGNPNAAQTAWATHMFSCAINGEHPSEPNYIWAEAGTDFGVRSDNDPNQSTSVHNVYTNVMHLSAQLTAAGIPWRSYQEDLEFTTSEEKSASGTTTIVNPYNGTKQYNYGVKHNPMAFFNDTQNKYCYPMTNFWSDLTNGNIGRYNWITPDQYNEWHSALNGTYTYNGTAWTGDQSAIASGDNCLSIIIPKIMASAAYKDHGVIIIWTDETESTDDTNTTLPYIIISPLAKGNAYASTLPYNHSSDLKTMDEIFELAYQTNAIPAAYYDAQNDGNYDYVDGHSAPIYDLSDFFQGVPPVPPVAGTVYYTRPANVSLLIKISNLLTNVTDANGTAVALVGVGTDGRNLLSTNGTTLFNNGTYILYTNSITANVVDSFKYTVSDGQGGVGVGTVVIIPNNNIVGQTNVKLNVSTTNVTANFFGVPGFSYTVERSTNLTAGLGWVSISTNTVPANGLLQVIDNFQDLGIPIPPVPSGIFYRLRYNP
jgi:hypothetical protein